MKTISIILTCGSAMRKRTLCLAAILALAMLPPATPASENSLTPLRPGDRPTGLIQYELRSYDGLHFWHFSGLYSLPFHRALRFDHGANGVLTAYFATGDTNSPVLIGTVTGRPSGPKMRLRSTTALPEFVMWDDFSLGDLVDRKDRLTLAFDPTARMFSGTDRISRTWTEYLCYDPNNAFSAGTSVKLVRRGRTSVEPITFAVPDTADGTWTLLLNIVTSEKNRITGTASAHLPNGEVFPFEIAGTWKPSRLEASLLLKGVGEGKGANLRFELLGPYMSLARMRGKIAGQTLLPERRSTSWF